MNWSEVAQFVGTVGAIAVAYWQFRRTFLQYPSRKIQDAVSMGDAYGDLIDDYRLEVKRLRDDVAALRAELGHDEDRISQLETKLRAVTRALGEYRRGVDILIAQLRRLGVDPEWTPPHDEPNGTPQGF